MKRFLTTLIVCFISLAAVADEIPQPVLESQLGVSKSYEGIDEVRQYATFGANLLIQKLELMSSQGDQVREQLNQGNFPEALAIVGRMSSERLAYENLREQVKDEFGSIFRSFFQPGLDSRHDDVAELYDQISSPYLIFYQDFLFRTLGFTGRQIDSGSQSLVSTVEFYVSIYDRGTRNIPVRGAIDKVEEIQNDLDEKILTIRNFLSSIHDSE